MMPRPRFHKLEPKRRAAILLVAAEEFAHNGFERASYNRIIERAGLSKGAMYYYFDDKGDLYATVLRHLLDTRAVAADWARALPEDVDGLWRWVLDFWHRQLVASLDNPMVAAVARDFVKQSWALRRLPAVAELYAELDAMLLTLLVHGQKVGAVRADVPTELLLAVTLGAGEGIDRWFVDALGTLDEGQLIEILDKTVQMLRRMLQP